VSIVTHISPLSPDLMDEVHKLRYQAFCVENKWEPENETGREREAPDASSLFVLCYEDGIPMGTLRITPSKKNPHIGFIGRVVIPRACKDRPAMRSALIRGLVLVSAQSGITDWLGLMEEWFTKASNSYGLDWEQVGPWVDKNGKRQIVHMKALTTNTHPHFEPVNPISFLDAISA